MSEKPFWEGKTLMEIQNLDQRVKVTMENGDVFIGEAHTAFQRHGRYMSPFDATRRASNIFTRVLG